MEYSYDVFFDNYSTMSTIPTISQKFENSKNTNMDNNLLFDICYHWRLWCEDKLAKYDIDNDHVCDMECINNKYITIITEKPYSIYGCIKSGILHICGWNFDCYSRTNVTCNSEEVCVFSGRTIQITMEGFDTDIARSSFFNKNKKEMNDIYSNSKYDFLVNKSQKDMFWNNFYNNKKEYNSIIPTKVIPTATMIPIPIPIPIPSLLLNQQTKVIQPLHNFNENKEYLEIHGIISQLIKSYIKKNNKENINLIENKINNYSKVFFIFYDFVKSSPFYSNKKMDHNIHQHILGMLTFFCEKGLDFKDDNENTIVIIPRDKWLRSIIPSLQNICYQKERKKRKLASSLTTTKFNLPSNVTNNVINSNNIQRLDKIIHSPHFFVSNIRFKLIDINKGVKHIQKALASFLSVNNIHPMYLNYLLIK